MGLPEGVTFAASFTCWTCGHTVKTKPGGVRPKHHGCRFRLIGRTRRKAYLDGWHSGYRFAVENPDDPMCLADADDYGDRVGGCVPKRRDRDSGGRVSTCRCGNVRDRRNMCPHCDAPIKCEPGCVACRTRDSFCIMCRTNCGSPAAAGHHENECRRKAGKR